VEAAAAAPSAARAQTKKARRCARNRRSARDTALRLRPANGAAGGLSANPARGSVQAVGIRPETGIPSYRYLPKPLTQGVTSSGIPLYTAGHPARRKLPLYRYVTLRHRRDRCSGIPLHPDGSAPKRRRAASPRQGMIQRSAHTSRRGIPLHPPFADYCDPRILTSTLPLPSNPINEPSRA
jgi:hypothetical protein